MRNTSAAPRWVTLIALAFSCLTSWVSAIPGQPGTLDPTWGTQGRVYTRMQPSGLSSDWPNAFVVEPSGKVVIAGYCGASASNDFCLIRLNADGSVDSGFGNTGRVIVQIGSASAAAYTLTLQPDGKFVLSGTCSDQNNNLVFCAARLLGSGQIDVSFASAGKLVLAGDASPLSPTTAMVEPDGKLVFAGSCALPGATVSSFCVARFFADGSTDQQFGNAGKFVISLGSSSAGVTAAALQADGKILLGGYCIDDDFDFCFARISATGAIDASFGVGGSTKVAVGSRGDSLVSIAIQADGKFVAGGTCQFSPTGPLGNQYFHFCAARFDSNGALDLSLAGTGKLTQIVGGLDSILGSAVVQGDAKLTLLGVCKIVASGATSATPHFCSVRYNTDGSLDRSYGNSGTSIVSMLGLAFSSFTLRAASQPDNKLFLSSNCAPAATTDTCVVRLDGGPFGARYCSLDIDGDNRVFGTTDAAIHARIARGVRGAAVVQGLNFAPNAIRTSWAAVRDYLVSQCGMSLPM